MVLADRRNQWRAHRPRGDNRNDLRVAPPCGVQAAAVVAAVYRDLLRADGPARRGLWNRRVHIFRWSARDRDRAWVRYALWFGSIWIGGAMRRGRSRAYRVDIEGSERRRSRARRG